MASEGSIHARMKAMGIGFISMAEGVNAFKAAMAMGGPVVQTMYIVKWGKFLGGMKEVPTALSGFAPARKAGAAVAKKASAPANAVSLDFILDTLNKTTGNEVDPDVPLMEAGLDSLGAVELRDQLQAAA